MSLSCLWPGTDQMRAAGLWKYPNNVWCQLNKVPLLRHRSVIYSVLCPEPSERVFWSLSDVWAHMRNCWMSVLLKCIRTVQLPDSYVCALVSIEAAGAALEKSWANISPFPSLTHTPYYSCCIKCTRETPKTYKWNTLLAQTFIVRTSTLVPESINKWRITYVLWVICGKLITERALENIILWISYFHFLNQW